MKWNFAAKTEKQLSLTVGETVQIEEACEGRTVGLWDTGGLCLC